MKKLLAVAAFLLSAPAFAGAIKEVYTSHQEAVLLHLFDVADENLATFENTKFVTAQLGTDLAIASDVTIYDAMTDAYQTLRCTTYFVQEAPRSYEVVSTVCK